MVSFIIDGEIYSFHMSPADLIGFRMSGLYDKLKHALATQNVDELIELFGAVIIGSYCAKTKEDYNKFAESSAFQKIFMILAKDADLCMKFTNGIIGGMK